ncbi:MAG: hypothetical protein GH152_04500 [Dehalococcoidia bacterium]|nr:hypothetical protein [Dehalococcoidia bacterium]
MRKIIVQELIRAGAALPAWMWVLWYLQSKGVLTASTQILFAVSFGISALMFSVLVVLRTRTGREFQLKRVRYLLILLLVFGMPVFIWRMLAGEVTRAILFAVGVLFVCLLLFIVRKKAGMKW